MVAWCVLPPFTPVPTRTFPRLESNFTANPRVQPIPPNPALVVPATQTDFWLSTPIAAVVPTIPVYVANSTAPPTPIFATNPAVHFGALFKHGPNAP